MLQRINMNHFRNHFETTFETTSKFQGIQLESMVIEAENKTLSKEQELQSRVSISLRVDLKLVSLTGALVDSSKLG